MAEIILLPKNMARFMLAGLPRGAEVYYLSSDYQDYDYLCGRYPNLTFKRLDDLFHLTFNRIKGDLRLMTAKLGERYNDIVWWGSQQASLNTASTPLVKNIVYFFCARQIITGGQDTVFILESNALAGAISGFVSLRGHSCRYFGSRFIGICIFLRRLFYYLVQIGHFLVQTVLAIMARSIVPVFLEPKKENTKRVVLRSWVTDGGFDQEGKFKDRNFGVLSQWFQDKGYQVWILPMFFSFSMSARRFCRIVRSQQQQFIIPWDYLRLGDYFDVLLQSLAVIRLPVDNVFIEDQDVSVLVKESFADNGFHHSLSMLNLSVPLLKRLKDKGYEINAFYYPYEGNPPEKNFLIGCRRYFPEALVAGFQHTVFFPEQLAFYLAPGEDRYHPLPDKIICSGSIYEDLYRQAGIPERLLMAGPNLRFTSVNRSAPIKYLDSGKMHNFLIATTFSYDQDFELFAKVAAAINGLEDYRIWIRKHPVLSREKLVDFLYKIGLKNFDFADSGLLQDWLPKMHAIFSSGSSVTILEAVSMGIPVIRVVPGNTFFYDPLIWPEYPLKPAVSARDIVKDIEYIDKVRNNKETIFSDIAVKVGHEYFTQTSEERLKVFL